MLDKDRVFRHFRTMCGLDSAGTGPYRALCDAAAQYILNRLRDDVQLDRNMDRLCFAAAALAYGDWLEVGGSLASAQDIRVGDITLRESGGGGRGAAAGGSALREHFLAGVADLLSPPFVLAGMPGQPEESS